MQWLRHYKKKMAGTGVISEFVSEKALKQLADAEAAVLKLNNALMDTIDGATAASNTLAGSRGVRDYKTNSQAQARALNDVEKALQRQRAAEQQLQRERDRSIQQQIQQRRQQEQAEARETAAAERRAAREAREAARAEQRAAREAANIAKQSQAYKLLEAAYIEAQNVAQNYGAQLGVNSQQFINTSRTAQQLRAQLDAIDQPLGNYRRNVGNYRSAFDGLGNSINQLTRELPAFAVSAQTGILALSNNIPIFFDQIARTRTEVAALRAEGVATPGVFSRLVSSLFSWGTALSLGVTLLTIYGKEIGNFVKSLFQGKKALDEFATAQKNLNDFYKTSNREIAEQKSKLDILYKAATDNNNALKDRRDAVDELQKQFPQTFKDLSDEAILTGGAKRGYDELSASIINNARARAAATKIAEQDAIILDADIQKQKIEIANANEVFRANEKARKQQEEFDKDPSRRRRGGGTDAFAQYRDPLIAQSNARAKAALDQQDALIKQAEATKRVITSVMGGNNAIAKGLITPDTNNTEKVKNDLSDLLAIAKDNEQMVLDNEQTSYSERLAAIDKYQSTANNLINSYRKKDIIDASEASKLLIGVETDTAKQRQDLSKRTLEQFKNAYSEYYNGLAQDEKEFLDAEANRQTERALRIDNEQANELSVLATSYASGELDKEKYEKKKTDIQIKYARQRLNNEIDTAEQLVAIQRAYFEMGVGSEDDLIRAEQALERLKIKLKELNADETEGSVTTKDPKERLKNIEEAIRAVTDFEAAAVNTINGLYERQIQSLERRKKALQDTANEEIAAVNRTLDSQTNKQAKIELINAQSASKQAALEKQIAQRRRQQAVIEKAANAAQILQNTYVAVTKTYATAGFFGGLFGAIAMAGIGAAQLAALLAVPIPEYHTGVDSHKGGLAIVGDRYGKELAKLPNGSLWETPGTSTLVDLPRGTQIFNNKEYMQMLAKPEPLNIQVRGKQDNGDIVRATKELGDKMVGAFRTRTAQHQPVRSNKWNNIYNGMKK